MRNLLPVPVVPHKGQSFSVRMPADSPPILSRVLFAQDTYIVPKADGRIVVGATVEAGSFDPRGVGNARLLFHGSKPSSFVGLLSRGLLLPQVVSAMGGGRTDEGFLGLGIYLAPNLADAARYAPPACAEYDVVSSA